MDNVAQRDIVARHVEDAVAKGATVRTGGRATAAGIFFEPTVLVDLNHSMDCIREETFGPTLPVIKVADEAEAIRLASDSVFALSASVWTRDLDRGRRVARLLEARAGGHGTASAHRVNRGDVVSGHTPGRPFGDRCHACGRPRCAAPRAAARQVRSPRRGT